MTGTLEQGRRSSTAVLAALSVGLTAQVPVNRPRITGIDHIVFRASDAAAARRFYGDVLGLWRSIGGTVAGCPPSSPFDQQRIGPRLQFKVGQRQMIYVESRPPAGRGRAPPPPGLRDARPRSAGRAPDGQGHRRDARPGARGRAGGAIAVSDPDGHPLAFVQRDWPPQGRIRRAGRITGQGAAVDAHPARRPHRPRRGGGQPVLQGHPGVRRDLARRPVGAGRPTGSICGCRTAPTIFEYMLVSSPPDRRRRGVLHHVALLVPDIQAAWDAAGARTPAADRARLGPANVGRNGRWQLNLYDGDGTRTELMEPFTVR